jgi:hypothetical protein
MSRICIEKRPSTHKTSKIAHERKQLRKKKGLMTKKKRALLEFGKPSTPFVFFFLM